MRPSHTSQPLRFALWMFAIVACFVTLVLIMLWASYNNSLNERNQNAKLHAQMLEETVTRTLESVEIGLSVIVDELTETTPAPGRLAFITSRARNFLRFAPHLRQIVIIRDGKTLIDTQHNEPVDINMAALNINWRSNQQISSSLSLGQLTKGRFLPPADITPKDTLRQSFIPVALQLDSANASPTLIIATLNPGYLQRYIQQLPLHPEDGVFLIDFDGNALLNTESYSHANAETLELLSDTLSSGADEAFSQARHSSVAEHYLGIRLSNKYPLAVAIHLDHGVTLSLWLSDNKVLLLGLLSALLVLIIAAAAIVRSNHRAIKMKEQVQLLSKVVEHSPNVIMITDAEGEIEYVNTAFEQVTGYPRDQVIGNKPNFLKSGQAPAEDYKNMWKTLLAGETWHGEFHNKDSHGNLFWQRSTIGSLTNDEGQITHFMSLNEVITQEKETEDKLRLASVVFNSAAEAIMVTDNKNRIQLINPAFCKVTGYTENEVVGRTPKFLRSGKHDQEFYEEMYQKLADTGYWEGEIWNQRKNQDVYPQWLSISVRYDQEGNNEGYVALFNDISKRKQDEALIRRQANFDSLTGLPNRNLFADRLHQAVLLSQRGDHELALLFIDLDRFKYVNDTFGHHVGDTLLKQVAERLRSCVRKSDTIARLGGDEFAIIIPDLDSAKAADKIADKVLMSLEQPYLLRSYEAFISCSIGIAILPEGAEDYEQLVLHADAAMYRAKEKGRNTKEYFSKTLNDIFQQKNLLEKEIFKALAANQLFLLYQPIWSIDGASVEAVEALLRWNHPERGMISPAEFIPVAEETGCIHNIGNWVIEQACLYAKQLKSTLPSAPSISINVSGIQFQRGGVATAFAQALEDTEVRGQDLIVEITESVLLLDEAIVMEQLETLRDMGIQIALDDFGTGFSSLSYLKRYPISKIKVDKSFINELNTDLESQALVSGIISMARSLNLSVVVEGVETEEQFDLLRGYGAHYIQGYLLAKPLPPEEVIALIERKHQTLDAATQETAND